MFCFSVLLISLFFLHLKNTPHTVSQAMDDNAEAFLFAFGVISDVQYSDRGKHKSRMCAGARRWEGQTNEN